MNVYINSTEKMLSRLKSLNIYIYPGRLIFSTVGNMDAGSLEQVH